MSAIAVSIVRSQLSIVIQTGPGVWYDLIWCLNHLENIITYSQLWTISVLYCHSSFRITLDGAGIWQLHAIRGGWGVQGRGGGGGGRGEQYWGDLQDHPLSVQQPNEPCMAGLYSVRGSPLFPPADTAIRIKTVLAFLLNLSCLCRWCLATSPTCLPTSTSTTGCSTVLVLSPPPSDSWSPSWPAPASPAAPWWSYTGRLTTSRAGSLRHYRHSWGNINPHTRGI